jgi:hypothetical protein
MNVRITDPTIDFWVDVSVKEVGGAWVAVADLASTPEIVAARRPELAVLLALMPLGPTLARSLALQARDCLDNGSVLTDCATP